MIRLKKLFINSTKEYINYSRFKDKHLGTLMSVDVKKKIAALTFDDGPDPIWTPKILEVLDNYSAKATFFVIGKKVNNHPEIVKRAFESNHAIANHTWDHACLPLISRIERIKQIRKCGKSIGDYDSKLFRPPYGYQNMATRFDAFLCGYNVVGWDMGPTDWKDTEPEVMANELNEEIHPGAIILLHDAAAGRSRLSLLEALKMFLEKNADYQFVTIPEMLKHGKQNKSFWIRNPNIDLLKRFEMKNKSTAENM